MPFKVKQVIDVWLWEVDPVLLQCLANVPLSKITWIVEDYCLFFLTSLQVIISELQAEVSKQNLPAAMLSASTW